MHKETLVGLWKKSNELFKSKYDYDLFKGSRTIGQVLTQAEIDLIGLTFNNEDTPIYAVDIAFHKAGLNRGSKDETVASVLMKIIRTVMCIYGYFGFNRGEIVFCSPKVSRAVVTALKECEGDIQNILSEMGFSFKTKIHTNEEFYTNVLQPVLECLGNVADTSELFMRSMQMYNLFEREKYKQGISKNVALQKTNGKLEQIAYNRLEALEEMKIGVIVRNVLRKLLEEGTVSSEEIDWMQTPEYSKKTFDIQYQLLLKADTVNDESPKRYYAEPVVIRGTRYFLCSEWFEVEANNDRQYLMKWLKDRIKE
jgi:hypothetical protein